MKKKVRVMIHEKEMQDYREIRIYEVSEDANKETNRYVNDEKTLTNLATTRRKIIELLYLNMNADSTFITLTYKINQQDYQQAQKDFNTFIKRLNYHLKLKTLYLGVKELQTRGAIHYHIIFFTPQIRDLTNDTICKLWGHGFTYMLPIHSYHVGTHEAVANYFSKYLTNYLKGQLIARDKKLFFTSRSIKRPKITEVHFVAVPHLLRTANIIVGNQRMTKLLMKKID